MANTLDPPGALQPAVLNNQPMPMLALDPQLVALAQENTRTATWEWIEATDELRWTSGQTEIYSRPADEINCTEAWESLVHPEDRERLRSAVENALQTGTGYRERFRVAGRDGATLWILGYAQVVRDPDHSTRLVGVNLDMTDWVDALIASETRFTATFEQAAVGIAHVALDGTWLNVNRRCAEIVGYPKEELLGLKFSDVTHPHDLDADWALVRELLEGERDTYSLEKRYFTKDGRLVWVNLTVSLVRKPDNNPDYFISVIEDITLRKRIQDERDELIVQLEERVRERTAELERLSLTDPLTGIANRRSFDRCLEAEWDRAVRTRQPLSLILIDIDFFKNMNDSAGHSAADDALRAVSACLSQVAQRSADLAARYGGDEFVLILPDTSADGALMIASRVQELVEKLGVSNPGSSIDSAMTVSQGLATASPDSKGTWRSLLLAADRALYRAKQTGRARIAVADARTVERPGQ
jgi:diguanylate cyclase (GGDEF)-like protein/PAS domain S-box-containing protein